MKIKIKQSVLKRELGFIQSVVQQKSTIPVLSHLLFETIGEKEVRIWATDLDVSIRCDIEAEVITPGSICLQARKISDIVRNVDDCDMHFKLDKKSWINLKAARSNFRLAGIDREKFPEIAKPNGTAMSFPADVLEYMIKHTAFAITTEQSRFTLNGAKFVLNDKTARMVATDGHRLAFIEKEMPTKAAKNVDTLIPKKALLELAKMAGEQSGNINISEDPQHIFFEGETRLLIARKLTGTFPNYEMIMPKDNGHRAEFDLNEIRTGRQADRIDGGLPQSVDEADFPEWRGRAKRSVGRRRRGNRDRTRRLSRRGNATRFSLAVSLRVSKSGGRRHGA
jgi:DNA polymerase-3 subunit beta